MIPPFHRMLDKLRELRSLKAELATAEGRLERRIDQLARLMDDYKSAQELDESMASDFRTWKLANPLSPTPSVSVCVATFNRPRLLVQRCLASILEQDFPRLEVIIVGDHAGAETVAAMGAITDSRVRFVNLSDRGSYPIHPEFRWMVAGSVPSNTALELASGDFVTHLDDDDEYLPGRITALVDHAVEHDADIVWHPFYIRHEDGSEALVNAEKFDFGNVTTGSVLYRSWFKQIGWDPQSWRLREPGDWNRFRKFAFLRPKMVRCPIPLLRHYRERSD